MVTDLLRKLLFGQNVKEDEPIMIYSLDDGELTLNLNEDILSQIISIPEPFDDSQRTALQDRISIYEIEQKENSANQENLIQGYETMKLPDVISEVLTIINDSGEARDVRCLNDPLMFKINYIHKAIQKISELKSADLDDRFDLSSETKRVSYEIENSLKDEMLKDKKGSKDVYPFSDSDFLLRGLSALELIDSMENPTIDAIFQKILDTEPIYEEALKEKREDLNLRYGSVKCTMNDAKISGSVSKALNKSWNEEVINFKKINKPFITSNDLSHLRNTLLYTDLRYKQYKSEGNILKNEADSIEQIGRHRLNLMDLKDGNVSDLYGSLGYNLEKIYYQNQGITNFEGSVELYRNPNKKIIRHTKEFVVNALLETLIEEGLQTVNRNDSLVIDDVAVLSLNFSYPKNDEVYLDKINYKSDLGQLDATLLSDELMRVQKIYQIAGRVIKDLSDIPQYKLEM